MKRKYLLIALVGLFTFSCEKDNPVTKKDEIVYNDIYPDKEIQTVRFYTFYSNDWCQANYPTPADSSVNFDLDLNEDKVTDFRIIVKHSLFTDGYCGHCEVFTYWISIEGLSEKDSIANSPVGSWSPKIFNESEIIDNNNKWASFNWLIIKEGCMLPFQTDFDDGYLGVKIENSYGFIKIEKLEEKGIRILEYGFNKTENNIIKCGQTE